MAKKKKTGLNITVGSVMYLDKCIVIDHDGVPWIIDPSKGVIRPCDIKLPAVKKSAVK